MSFPLSLAGRVDDFYKAINFITAYLAGSNNSFDGTCLNTVAAVGAQFGIDNVDFSLADGINRARIDTASTGSAFIIDNVSQGVHLLLKLNLLIKCLLTNKPE
jgi:hypothetical protein